MKLLDLLREKYLQMLLLLECHLANLQTLMIASSLIMRGAVRSILSLKAPHGGKCLYLVLVGSKDLIHIIVTSNLLRAMEHYQLFDCLTFYGQLASYRMYVFFVAVFNLFCSIHVSYFLCAFCFFIVY
jgi:hypothetical protein